MNFLKSKILTIVLFLSLVLIIIIGITANNRGNLGSVQNVINTVVSPIQKYMYRTSERIGSIYNFIATLSDTRKENTALKRQVDELNNRLMDYDRFKTENDELNKILGFKNSRSDLKMVSANVVGRVGNNWLKIIIIDAGAKDGIKKGQYVVNGNGLVGQVFEVNETTSKVMTLNDEKINIPGRVSSTQEEGIVSGESNSSSSLCIMRFLPQETKAVLSDPIVTSDIIKDNDVPVPAGLLIGFIDKIESDGSTQNTILYIKLVVDYKKLTKVMVITK